MSTEIVAATPQAVTRQEPASLMDVIARAAKDPNVDVAKMQALLDMKYRVEREDARSEFWAAMARLQPHLPRITKNGQILNKDGSVRSTYATYQDIDIALRPQLEAEGFAVFFDSMLKETVLFVTARVAHKLGHSETTTIPVPIDTNSYRTKAQDMGSTISYGKRYALCAAFNIITVDEDTDSVVTGEPITLEQKNQILDLLIATNANGGKFLAWLGCSSVEDIRQGEQFERAVDALKRKLKK